MKIKILYLERSILYLNFKSVEVGDVSLLCKLFKKRRYSVIHQSLPSSEFHKEFIRNHPYIFWFIIYEN